MDDRKPLTRDKMCFRKSLPFSFLIYFDPKCSDQDGILGAGEMA